MRRRRRSICDENYDGFGNNAWPYKGCCCDECNEQHVVPARSANRLGGGAENDQRAAHDVPAAVGAMGADNLAAAIDGAGFGVSAGHDDFAAAADRGRTSFKRLFVEP